MGVIVDTITLTQSDSKIRVAHLLLALLMAWSHTSVLAHTSVL